jgi:hypothetical protein
VTVTENLAGVRFTKTPFVFFDGIEATGVDFSGLTFEKITTGGCLFVDCDFRRAKLRSGMFGAHRQSRFVRCRFEGADLRGGRLSLGQARFESCVFDGARLDGWRSYAAEFVDCHFAGRIEEVIFFGRPFVLWADPGALDPPRTTNAFTGNDFRAADLHDIAFKDGIDIDANLMPDGPEYVRLDRWMERVALARAEVARWPDATRRERTLELLQDYGGFGFEEQEVLFVRPEPIEYYASVEPELWKLLASVL